jgi:DNA-directed RNA polymerase subunit RPC12/RpoP
MATDEEREQEWREEAMDEAPCPACKGRGYQTVELDGGGQAYACPDCGSTGEDDDE